MSNIYLKVTIETFSKLRFSGFKKFVTRLVFGELQLTQILLNFKNSCCNLKIRGLGAKLWVAFLFWKELWRFKVKKACILVNKNLKFNKNETESKMENPPTHMCFSSYKNCELKVKLSWFGARERKRVHFL